MNKNALPTGSTDRSFQDPGSPVPRSGFFAIAGGATTAFVSAILTTLLLLFNGSITLIVLGAFADDRPDWLNRQGLLQFALFTLPLVMLVIEWMIWDFLCGLLSRERPEED